MLISSFVFFSFPAQRSLSRPSLQQQQWYQEEQEREQEQEEEGEREGEGVSGSGWERAVESGRERDRCLIFGGAPAPKQKTY